MNQLAPRINRPEREKSASMLQGVSSLYYETARTCFGFGDLKWASIWQQQAAEQSKQARILLWKANGWDWRDVA